MMAIAPTTEIQVQRFVAPGQTCEPKFAKSLRVSATWSMQTHLIHQYGRELIDVPGSHCTDERSTAERLRRAARAVGAAGLGVDAACLPDTRALTLRYWASTPLARPCD